MGIEPSNLSASPSPTTPLRVSFNDRKTPDQISSSLRKTNTPLKRCTRILKYFTTCDHIATTSFVRCSLHKESDLSPEDIELQDPDHIHVDPNIGQARGRGGCPECSVKKIKSTIPAQDSPRRSMGSAIRSTTRHGNEKRGQDQKLDSSSDQVTEIEEWVERQLSTARSTNPLFRKREAGRSRVKSRQNGQHQEKENSPDQNGEFDEQADRQLSTTRTTRSPTRRRGPGRPRGSKAKRKSSPPPEIPGNMSLLASDPLRRQSKGRRTSRRRGNAGPSTRVQLRPRSLSPDSKAKEEEELRKTKESFGRISRELLDRDSDEDTRGNAMNRSKRGLQRSRTSIEYLGRSNHATRSRLRNAATDALPDPLSRPYQHRPTTVSSAQLRRNMLQEHIEASNARDPREEGVTRVIGLGPESKERETLKRGYWEEVGGLSNVKKNPEMD